MKNNYFNFEEKPSDPYEEKNLIPLDEQGSSTLENLPKRKILSISYLFLIKSILTKLEYKLIHSLKGKDSPYLVIKLLEEFSNLLQLLIQKDLSHKPFYLNSLSQIFILLEKSNHAMPQNSVWREEIEKIFKELDSYPQKMQFSFKHYLSNFAGFKWIPFPFMEMLHKLHLQAKAKPMNNLLRYWILMIDQIIHNK
ncbi:MAG TPA: hypothetical protein P5048_02000 [Chlamydiales bacterium]|nr:hypothetical protein [Chlamydiales bacterium]